MDSIPSQETNEVLTFLHQELDVIRNPFVNIAVIVLPVLILLYLVVGLLIPSVNLFENPMLFTGWLAAEIAFILLLIVLLYQLPKTLEMIWSRGILELPSPRASGWDSGIEKILRIKWIKNLLQSKQILEMWTWIDHLRFGSPKMAGNLKDRYIDYIKEYDRRLNNPIGCYLSGVIFSGIMFVAFLFQEGFIGNSIGGDWIGSIDIHYLFQFIVAFFIGILTWKVIVVGWQVSRLGKYFDFNIQTKHPDNSGGFNPLGDLCLMNALIFTVPSIYLGGWILILKAGLIEGLDSLVEVGSKFPLVVRENCYCAFGYCDFQTWCCDKIASPDNCIPILADVAADQCAEGIVYDDFLCTLWGYMQWSGFFGSVLLVIVVLTFLAFILPLYCLHRDMVRQFRPIQHRLDIICKKISALSLDSLKEISEGKPDNIGKRNENLELLQGIYDMNSPVVTWPFNKQIVFKYLLSQIVPILALFSIGETWTDLIGSLLGL